MTRNVSTNGSRAIPSTYHVRDWIEIRREVASAASADASTLYLRQLAELEARLAASESASEQQIERLAQQGDVTQ